MQKQQPTRTIIQTNIDKQQEKITNRCNNTDDNFKTALAMHAQTNAQATNSHHKNRHQRAQNQTAAPTSLLKQQLPTRTKTVVQQSTYGKYKRTTIQTTTQTTVQNNNKPITLTTVTAEACVRATTDL